MRRVFPEWLYDVDNAITRWDKGIARKVIAKTGMPLYIQSIVASLVLGLVIIIFMVREWQMMPDTPTPIHVLFLFDFTCLALLIIGNTMLVDLLQKCHRLLDPERATNPFKKIGDGYAAWSNLSVMLIVTSVGFLTLDSPHLWRALFFGGYYLLASYLHFASRE